MINNNQTTNEGIISPVKYFEEHCLDPDFIKEHFGVTWSDEEINIPICDQDGNVIYSKHRILSGNSKYRFDPGGHPTIFCSDKITEHGRVVLSEGEVDCMKLWQEGIPSATGTGGVKTFNAKIAKPLTGKEVILCLDNDKAGQESIRKYGDVLQSLGCKTKVVKLPSETKDICEYFASGYSKEEFCKLLNESISYEDWLIENEPSDFAWESIKELLSAEIKQEKWIVDRVLPYEGFCFIAGPEGCGKSFHTLTLAHSVAYGEPWLDKFKSLGNFNVLFIDKENSRASIQKRLKGLGISDPENRIYRIVYPEKLQLVDEKGKYTDFIVSVSIKVKKYSIKLIIIDSFTDIMEGDENARNDTQNFFTALRELFPNVSFLVLHHINKSQVGSGKSSSERFRGSSNITAQLSSGFLIKKIANVANEYVLEQTKARDSKKLPEFKVNLVSLVDPSNPNDTYVSKIMYAGEHIDDETKRYEVAEVVNKLLDESNEIYRKDIDSACQSKNISGKTIQRALEAMKESGVIVVKTDPNPANHRRNIYHRPTVKADPNQDGTV